jgi:hypothetical protein
VSGTRLAGRSCRSAGTVLPKLDMIRGLDFCKSHPNSDIRNENW